MSNIILQNLKNITYFSVSFLAIYFFVFLTSILIKRKRENRISLQFDELYKKISEDIKYSVAPKFMEISLGMNNLIDLAVEVWRIEQRISKASSGLPENQLKGLENSVQKMRRCLEKYDIQIVDYKNQKYNDGLNLDVLSIEKDDTLKESMIKETVEPTIMCKGQVVRKAKIILLSN